MIGEPVLRQGRGPFPAFAMLVLLCGWMPSALAQGSLWDASSLSSSGGQFPNLQEKNGQEDTGTVRGLVLDHNGASIAGARVTLVAPVGVAPREAVTGDDGRFVFPSVSPGKFTLSVAAPGFAPQTRSGAVRPGEELELPTVSLPIATATEDARVVATRREVAEAQIEAQERQRVLGVIPNFFVSYVHDAVPLAPAQKFELAWKTTLDPTGFVITGAIAGVQQAQNDFKGYGQGAEGYAKRYGAAYGDFFIGTMIGSAILPSVLKQDPRYFYKGTGGTRARLLYAMANSVVCRGDNGRWQPNYSGIVGGLAAAGISNLYYPAASRNGAGLTFENALIGIGAGAAGNVIQEFFVRRLTPKLPPPIPAGATAKGE